MKRSCLRILRCPSCLASLRLAVDCERDGDIERGTLRCAGCSRDFPIVKSIPRFVPSDNYANNFGFQWNEFSRTQLDSQSGLPISRERFLAQTHWDESTLRGKLVLDAGCGSGRFAEVVLMLGAEVVGIDYSTAVDAAWRNLGSHPRFHVAQGDIYALPFAPGTFDFVYSLGVLQHTPDVRGALFSLVSRLKPGGSMAVDFYFRRWLNALEPKYWLRPLTTRMRQERLFSLIRRSAPALLRFSGALGRVPLAGRLLRRLVPVANYEGIYPLDAQQLEEWAVLDTFDWLAPRHDHPQRPHTVESWMRQAGLEGVEVEHVRHLTGRGVKPVASRSPGLVSRTE